MNEPARNNSIHGLLWNRTLTVLAAAGGVSSATLTLGFTFDNTDPGYPFHLGVSLTYQLTASGFNVTVEATNLDDHWPAPFFNSWHPYFLCNVSTTRVIFDACTEWNHVEVRLGCTLVWGSEHCEGFAGAGCR
jgi:aldose 1-epimerase